MGDNIKWLSNLSKKDLQLTGNKGANLGEIYNTKFPVPQAFVITTDTISTILEQSKTKQKIKDILNKIDTENKEQLQEKSDEIQKLISSIKIPDALEKEILEAYDHFNIDLNKIQNSPGALAILKSAREPVFVSIRTSPTTKTQSQTALLNIKGNKTLLQKIKECLASDFTPKLIQQRKEKGLDPIPGIAIIIQRMINADISGKIFSKNPNNKNEILIKSIFGLGTGFMSKEIQSDQYTLSQDLEITSEKITDKKLAITRTAEGTNKLANLELEKIRSRTLKTHQIKELAQYAQQIEQHYKKPQQIEFSIENGTIYILQTKTITKTKQPQSKNQKILPIIKTKTQIKININSTEEIFEARKTSTEGIGLIKIESLNTSQESPIIHRQKNTLDQYKKNIETELEKITNAFPQKPIWIKSYNTKNQNEKNPLLGNHGIRFSLKNREIFETELKALKTIIDKNNKIGIILSQVTSPDEIKQTQELLKELGIKNLQLGIAIETPAATTLIKDICEQGIDFISFKTDNLTQYTLATDKENEEIQYIYDEISWAVLKQISRVIRECKKQGIKTSICEQNELKPEMVKFLIKQGIGSISVNADAAYEISKLVQELEKEEPSNQESKIEKIDNKEEAKKEKPLNPESTEEIEDVSNTKWKDIKEKPKKEEIFE
jgi:phosphoenolpyruvate synthase/pyruvate phosphate dikinase